MAVAVLSLGAIYALPANAVHDGFELDRNATSSGTVPGDDWDLLDDGAGDPNNDDAADASTFTFDGRGPTIFTGGGSKDDLDTTGWKHKSGNVPDKDDLLDGYAARYGDNLYFGADRYSASGDAQMGFWFFQQEVMPLPDGTFGPGQHEDGDVLVLSNFTGGGTNTTIRVFQWNGPGGTTPGSGAINGTLDLIGGTVDQTADCVGPPAVPDGDPFCATVNQAPTASPWSFTPKSGPSGTFPTGHFYEGGIDLAFLNLDQECFASFVGETRSSASVDATLKDFVGGGFEKCDASVKTTPSDANGNALSSITLGESIYDSALIEGTGSNNPPTGTMTFFICSPSQLTDGTCSSGGTEHSTNDVTGVSGTSNATARSDAFTPTSTGTWCWRGVYSGDSNYPTATDSSTGECFTVNKLPSQINTTPRVAGNVVSSITLGDSITDHALLTGTAAGGHPTGTVTFFICSPSQLTPVNTGTCETGGSQVGAAAVTLTQVGSTNTSEATSASTTPNAVGKWCFRGVYSGDDDYLGSTDSDASECFMVAKAPTTISTAQRVHPQDSATISASQGGNVAGSVVFSLYNNSTNCQSGGTTGRLYTEAVGLPGNATSSTVSTNNTSVTVNTNTTVYWRVAFTSSNPSQLDSSSVCVENTTVSFVNDPPPAP